MKVKICGITNPEDARIAAQAGADYIGMILSPLSKRYVSPGRGKEIALAAREYGAEPVAVFVEENLGQIMTLCYHTDTTTIQLHGEESKKYRRMLCKHYAVISAVSVQSDGAIPEQSPDIPGMYTLFDYGKGGSGITFDWRKFCPPANRPWILAGGLTPKNVSIAIKTLAPHAVDVSTGVELTGTTRKDAALIRAFVKAAKETV